MNFKLFIAFLFLIGAINAVPTKIYNHKTKTCSNTCLNHENNLMNKIGHTYNYNYDSKSLIEMNDGQTASVHLSALVDVSTISKCEYQMRLRDVKIVGPKETELMKKQLEHFSTKFSQDNSIIDSICFDENEEKWAINIKKAIISNLQVTQRDSTSRILESDVLGLCDTLYEKTKESSDLIMLERTKFLDTCTKKYRKMNFITPRMSEDEKTICKIELNNKKNILQTIKCEEINTLPLFTLSKAASKVSTHTKLTFENIVNTLPEITNKDLIKDKLHFNYGKWKKTSEEDQTKILLRTEEILEKINSRINYNLREETPEQVKDLSELLEKLNNQSLESLARRVSKYNKKTQYVFFDTVAQTNTLECADLILKVVLDNHFFKEELSTLRKNYWLTILNNVEDVNEKVFSVVSRYIKRENLPRQALLGLTSLISNVRYEFATKENSEYRQIVEALITRLERTEKKEHKIVILKALRNTGIHHEVFEKIYNLIIKTKDIEIQTSALEILDEHVYDKNIYNKIFKIYQDESYDALLRISAFKVLIINQERIIELYQVLKRESNTQVGSYVLSYFENIRKSSDERYDALKSIISTLELPEGKFNKNRFSNSKNFVLYKKMEQVDMEVEVESDLVFDNQDQLRKIRTEFYLNKPTLLNKKIEVTFMQNGLPEVAQHYLQQLSKEESLSTLFEELYKLSSIRSKKMLVEKMNKLFETIKLVNLNKINKFDKNVDASMNIKYGDKNILYINLNDLENWSISERNFEDKKAILNEITKTFLNEHTLTLILNKRDHQRPTFNGVPVHTRHSYVFMFALKSENGAIYPSVAANIHYESGFTLKTLRPAVLYSLNLHSAPGLKVNVEFKNNVPVRLVVKMPENRLNIISVKSSIKFRTLTEETELKVKTDLNKDCTKFLNKIFGVELCYKAIRPTTLVEKNALNVLFNGPFEYSLYIGKSDLSIKEWELTFETPLTQKEGETKTLRFGFDTVNSKVDRKTFIELELQNRQDLKIVNIHLKTPKQTIKLEGKALLNNKNAALKGILMVDNIKYEAEISGEQIITSDKFEIKPIIRLIVPGMRKFDYTGKILLTNSGKKDNLIVELMDKITQKHLLKASFIKSGKFGLKDNLKLATDLHAYWLSGSNIRFVSNIDKSDKGISSDLEIIHYASHKAPTTYKWKFGLQNLSNESVEKLNADFELNIPRTSFENIAFSWNFANRYGQEIENEFLAFWKNQKTGQKQRQVHVSQSLKMNKLSAKISSLWENFMKIEIVPLEINYDIQTKNSFKRSQQKYQIQMNVRNVNTEKHYTGDLQYQISDTYPLKYNIEAKVNIENNEFKFIQSLVEQEKRNYLGRTLIQLAKDQEIELNYVYKIKDQNLGKKVLHHELEAELKVPFKSIDLKHKSNLRMTHESIELEHFLKKNNMVLSDVKIILKSLGQSQLFVDNQLFKLKTTVDLTENKNEIYLLIDGKALEFSHESKLNWSKKTIDLVSKTLSEKRQIIDLLVKFVESQDAELRLNSKLGDLVIRTDYQKHLTTVEINSMYRNKKVSHKTQVLREANKYVLESKTLHDDKTIANVKFDFNLSKNPSSLLVKIFNWQITGKTTGGSQINLVLVNPIRNLREELNLQYQQNEGSIEFKHLDNKKHLKSVLGKLSLKDESKLQYTSEHIDVEFLLRPVGQNKHFKLELNDKKHSLQHKTDLKIQKSEITFEINHQRYNKNVLKHITKLSLNDQSMTKTETKDFTFEAIYKITKSLEISFNHQNGLKHLTNLDLDLTKMIKLSSKTTKNGKNLFLVTLNSELFKNFDLRMNLENNNLVVKSKMGRENNVEILFTNQELDHKTELTFEIFKKFNLISETKNLRKSEKNVRFTIEFLKNKKFDLLFRNEYFEIISKNTKETKENKMILEILNLKTKEQYKGLINLEKRSFLNLNLEKLHSQNVVAKFSMKINHESLVYEFNNERMTLKNSFELKDRTMLAKIVVNHLKKQIQHETTLKIDRIEKEIHLNSVTTKENKKSKLEMRINLKDRKNYLRIESEEKHLKIEANLNKNYIFELVDAKTGSKHASELNLEKNLFNLQAVHENKKYIELSTQLKDGKLVFDLKSKRLNLLVNGDLYKKDLVLNLDYINLQDKHCQTELLVKNINNELRFNFNNKHFDFSKTNFKFVLNHQNKFDTEFNFEETSSPNKIHFVFNTIKNIDGELSLNLRTLRGKADLKTLSKNTFAMNVEVFNKQNQKIVDIKSNLNNKDDKIVFTVDCECQEHKPYTLNVEIGKESEVFEVRGLIKSRQEQISSFVAKYNMRNNELVLNSEMVYNQEKYEFNYNLVLSYQKLSNSLKIKTTRKTYGYDLNVDYKQGKFIIHMFDRIVEFNYNVQRGNDGHYVVDVQIIPDVKKQPNNVYNVKLINFVKYTHEEAIYDSKIVINHPRINVPIELVVRFEARNHKHQRPLTIFVSYDASKDQKHRLSALFEITNESNLKVAHFNVSHQNHIIFDVQYKWAFLQNLHHQQLLWSVLNKDNQNVARDLLFRINYTGRKALISLDNKHKLDIDWEEKSDETHVVVLVKSENLLRKIRILLKENHIEMTTFENGKIRSIYVANIFRQRNSHVLVELNKKEGKTFQKLAFFELAKDEFKFAKVHFKFEKRVIYLVQKTLGLLKSKTIQMIDNHYTGSSELVKRHYEETQMRSQIENTKKLFNQINEDIYEIMSEYSQLVKYYFPNLHRQVVYLKDEILQKIREMKNIELEREWIKLNQYYHHQKKQFLIFVAELKEEMNVRMEKLINKNLLKDFNRKIQENVHKVVKITDAKIEKASHYLEEKLNENRYVRSLFIKIREIMTKAKEMIKKSDLLELNEQLLVSRRNIETEWNPKNGEFLAQIYLPIQIANWLH